METKTSKGFMWFVEKVLVPLIIALIAAYASLIAAKILPNPLKPKEPTSSATFSSISSNKQVNSLFEGQEMTSPNKQHVLKVMNGNIILYSYGGVAWSTDTEWSGGDHLSMQADGNLVLYTSDQRFVWDTNTPSANPAKSYTLSLLDNGNLVITDSNGKVTWSIK